MPASASINVYAERKNNAPQYSDSDDVGGGDDERDLLRAVGREECGGVAPRVRGQRECKRELGMESWRRDITGEGS
jgi:hypothetical protein